MKAITLGFAGASGAPYALRLLEQLVKADVQVSMVASKVGQLILHEESDLALPGNPEKMAEALTQHFNAKPRQITVYGKEAWHAPIASGSGAPKTMVVCPCSVGCVSAIATGASNNLLERAADVVLKEQGKLVLVVREMPFSVIHLEHMLSLAKQGVTIMPANPGFYFKPQTVQDLIDFVVARICDQIGISHALSARWGC